jgi:hypothetical protein
MGSVGHQADGQDMDAPASLSEPHAQYTIPSGWRSSNPDNQPVRTKILAENPHIAQ